MTGTTTILQTQHLITPSRENFRGNTRGANFISKLDGTIRPLLEACGTCIGRKGENRAQTDRQTDTPEEEERKGTIIKT